MILRYLIVLTLFFAASHVHGEAYFVHGTGCDNSVWNDVIRKEIRETFGHQAFTDQIELFGWSGDNNTYARIEAADKLIEHIISSRTSQYIDEPCITLTGHSHGGNILLLASEGLRTALGSDIDINIITLNTPNVVGGAQMADARHQPLPHLLSDRQDHSFWWIQQNRHSTQGRFGK
jgi:triacylglycerol esterase/lipase EstA (alpha/beta hydrolase family)